MEKEMLQHCLAMLADVNIDDLRQQLLDDAMRYFEDFDIDELRQPINFSEATGELGWPDWQDEGIFEQALMAARTITLTKLSYTSFGMAKFK